MKVGDTRAWLKVHSARRRAEQEADRPRRHRVLTAEAAAHWSMIVTRAAKIAREIPASRPCDYGPWAIALARIAGPATGWPNAGRYYSLNMPEFLAVPPMDLMSFAWDAARPDWPEAHGHLVDFALTFLEADVMLFRSGYTKRHLLRRLRQAKLAPDQMARSVALIQRAVTEGTGLEEFREIARLARRVGDAALGDWLREQAQGACLTINDLDARDRARFYEFADEALLRKMLRHDRQYRFNYMIREDLTLPLVKREEAPENNKVAKNARKVLRAMDHGVWPI